MTEQADQPFVRPDGNALADRVRLLEGRLANLERLRSTTQPWLYELRNCLPMAKVADGQVPVYSTVDGQYHPETVGGGGGARFATIVVAPADATAASLAAADYVLTGTADQTILNTALAILGSWPNGRLVILEGWVRPSGPINIPAGVMVQGMNRHNGTYVAPDASWAGAAIFTMGGQGAQLRDLHIQGGALTAAAYGVSVTANDCVLGNVRIVGQFARFINLGGYSNTVRDCILAGAAVAADTSYGVYSTGIDSNRVQNCRIEEMGTGISTAGNYEHIVGNTVLTCRRDGIVVNGSTRSLLLGNRVQNSGQAASNTYDGIRLQGSAERVAVFDNLVEGPASGTRPRYGIRVDAGCVDNTVAHNDVKGAGQTAAYSDAGTTTLTLGGNRT